MFISILFNVVVCLIITILAFIICRKAAKIIFDVDLLEMTKHPEKAGREAAEEYLKGRIKK